MTDPTVSDFKAYFVRDFPYGTDPTTVMDSDIQGAIDEAGFNFNEALFSTQARYTTGYLYLAAHYLVMRLRASTQGIAGSFSWLTASKGVGSVSESFQIPQHILDNPSLALLSKTNYGARYLSLMLPQLVGQVTVSQGGTTP